MNVKEEFEQLISTWETLATLWDQASRDSEARKDYAFAAVCKARYHTFKRCANNVRGLMGINGQLPDPPPTVPGMEWEEHNDIEKLLNRLCR